MSMQTITQTSLNDVAPVDTPTPKVIPGTIDYAHLMPRVQSINLFKCSIVRGQGYIKL